MSQLKILVSRHSAFYTPLIGTLAGGFLKEEGLDATYAVLPPGRTSRDALRAGEAHLIQSAVSSNWKPMENGIADLPVHFAQINRRDGFFLISRDKSKPFDWTDLEGRSILADHAGQPLAMLKYAVHYNNVDWNRVSAVDAGGPLEIEAAFRAGTADFAHLQGPAAQRLEFAGVGLVCASVGASMPEVAFSSLTALPEFLATGEAEAFLRAYRKAKKWAAEADPVSIADAQREFFQDYDPQVLAKAIAQYQSIGCWAGGTGITPELYDQALNVFEHNGAISRRHPFNRVVMNV